MKHRLSQKDDQIELLIKIKEMMQDGVVRTKDIATTINRTERQTRRYLIEMSKMKMIQLTESKRLDKTSDQLKKQHFHILSKDEFVTIPEIRRWVDGCIARGVKATTINVLRNHLKFIFNYMSESPCNVLCSKKDALDFWVRFASEFRQSRPTVGTHNYRAAYRNLLAAHDITFANRMGAVYGLSAKNDREAQYAGVHLTSKVTKKIGDLILQNNDFALYVWWRLGLRTGARSGALATMTWDKIYFYSDDFKLEQHETKDVRGHFHLGENGEWKTKYLSEDMKKLLLQWKSVCPDKRFLWFADTNSDVQNRIRSRSVQTKMARGLKKYYSMVSDDVDSLTYHYMQIMPDHIMRHTLVQQMKNAGFTNEDIADSFGWRSADIVKNWYSKPSEKHLLDIASRAQDVKF